MKNILITGAAGALGSEFCNYFKKKSYFVIATDRFLPRSGNVNLQIDLNRYASDAAYRDAQTKNLLTQIRPGSFSLINNAAIQHVGAIENISQDQLNDSFNINAIAPFLLIQGLLSRLQGGDGCILNIGTIHAELTKKHFSAYAMSKAALISLTRSLSLELGEKVRVNAILPAAVDTPMLRAGFSNHSDLNLLNDFHPTRTIGKPEELSELAYFIVDSSISFLNGSLISIDGGIVHRLHDPS